MSDVSITKQTIERLEHYIFQNWIFHPKTSCFKREFLSRCARILTIPLTLITAILDTIVALGISIAAYGSLGMLTKVTLRACEHFESTRLILIKPIFNFFQFINPRTRVAASTIIEPNGHGFVSDRVLSLIDLANRTSASSICFVRHVVSRTLYLVSTIAFIIARLIDAIIAPFATLFALCALGTNHTLNNLAFRALQVPGVIEDIYCCTIRIINPWAL